MKNHYIYQILSVIKLPLFESINGIFDDVQLSNIHENNYQSDLNCLRNIITAGYLLTDNWTKSQYGWEIHSMVDQFDTEILYDNDEIDDIFSNTNNSKFKPKLSYNYSKPQWVQLQHYKLNKETHIIARNTNDSNDNTSEISENTLKTSNAKKVYDELKIWTKSQLKKIKQEIKLMNEMKLEQLSNITNRLNNNDQNDNSETYTNCIADDLIPGFKNTVNENWINEYLNDYDNNDNNDNIDITYKDKFVKILKLNSYQIPNTNLDSFLCDNWSTTAYVFPQYTTKLINLNKTFDWLNELNCYEQSINDFLWGIELRIWCIFLVALSEVGYKNTTTMHYTNKRKLAYKYITNLSILHTTLLIACNNSNTKQQICEWMQENYGIAYIMQFIKWMHASCSKYCYIFEKKGVIEHIEKNWINKNVDYNVKILQAIYNVSEKSDNLQYKCIYYNQLKTKGLQDLYYNIMNKDYIVSHIAEKYGSDVIPKYFCLAINSNSTKYGTPVKRLKDENTINSNITKYGTPAKRNKISNEMKNSFNFKLNNAINELLDNKENNLYQSKTEWNEENFNTFWNEQLSTVVKQLMFDTFTNKFNNETNDALTATTATTATTETTETTEANDALTATTEITATTATTEANEESNKANGDIIMS